VQDVALDLRKDSPTYGKHYSIILSEKNKKQFFIPKGFAHGYAVLSHDGIFQYKIDNYYSQESERGILYNSCGIDWKLINKDFIVNERDLKHPLFN